MTQVSPALARMGVREFRSIQVRQDVFMNRAFNASGVRIPGLIRRVDAALAPKSIALAEPPANVREALTHIESAVQMYLLCSADHAEVCSEVATENFVLATREIFDVIYPHAKRQDSTGTRKTIAQLLNACYSPESQDHYGKLLVKGMTKVLGFVNAEQEPEAADAIRTVLAGSQDGAVLEEALHSAITSGTKFDWLDLAYVDRPGGDSYFVLALIKMMQNKSRNVAAVSNYLRSLGAVFSVQSIRDRSESPTEVTKLFLGREQMDKVQLQIECFMSPFTVLDIIPSLTARQISRVIGVRQGTAQRAISAMIRTGSMVDNMDGTYCFVN